MVAHWCPLKPVANRRLAECRVEPGERATAVNHSDRSGWSRSYWSDRAKLERSHQGFAPVMAACTINDVGGPCAVPKTSRPGRAPQHRCCTRKLDLGAVGCRRCAPGKWTSR